MTLIDSRAAALRSALARTVGQPLRFFPLVAAAAVVMAALLLGGLAAWRLQPLEAPAWAHPQALVLAAGAEGQVDLAALGLALRKVAAVSAADFIGRDAALADLAQRPGLSSLGLRELRPNPLPDAFVVHFAAAAGPQAVESAVAELRKIRDVDSVQFQPDAYRRTWALARLARRLLIFAAVALAAAVVIGLGVAGALRVHPDPEEIRILDMLGADPAAMRRPYVYSGTLCLLLAAALAVWITAASAAGLDPPIADLAQQYGVHWSAEPIPYWYALVFCGAAAALGALLASLAIRLSIRAALS
jgi:cell division transport system permease protein